MPYDGGQENKTKKGKTIEEYGSIKEWINHEWLLPYLAIGGTRSDFWGLTPKEIQIDFEAYKIKCKAKQQEAWVQGVYFKSALQSSVLICGLADKKVINSMPKYAEVPYNDEIEELKAQDEKWVELERQKAFIHFKTLLEKKGK